MKKKVLRQLISEEEFNKAKSRVGSLNIEPVECEIDGYVATFLNGTITIVDSSNPNTFKSVCLWDWAKFSYSEFIDKLSRKQFKPF